MTTPLLSAKASMRQRVHELLNGMTPRQSEAASLQICAKLRKQEVWKSAGAILFFAPRLSEPDIWPLLEEALLAGKTVALPRFLLASQTYVAAQVRELQKDIAIGQFGIHEPVAACPEIPLSQLDLVLVPGVAFDAQGHRLGRGKGFYDRLLAEVRGVKCGVAFDEQIVEAVPAGPLDIRMNYIVTPTRRLEVK